MLNPVTVVSHEQAYGHQKKSTVDFIHSTLSTPREVVGKSVNCWSFCVSLPGYNLLYSCNYSNRAAPETFKPNQTKLNTPFISARGEQISVTTHKEKVCWKNKQTRAAWGFYRCWNSGITRCFFKSTIELLWTKKGLFCWRWGAAGGPGSCGEHNFVEIVNLTFFNNFIHVLCCYFSYISFLLLLPSNLGKYFLSNHRLWFSANTAVFS